MSAGQPTVVTASILNQLHHYASSNGTRAFCCAKLAASSLPMDETNAGIHPG